MSEMFAISRIEKYKYHDCGGVWKEAIRTLPKYDNPNLNFDLSYMNVHLIDNDIKNIEKYIVQYKEDYNIGGRFNLTAKNTKNAKNLTNVMCQSIFTCSNEYINSLSREDQIEFFKYCLEFFKEEFPDVPILSAVVHYDETTPHMHVTFLPIASRVNKKSGEKEDIFSTTLLMPGKDFYPRYQDRFYTFISAKYDGLTRRKSTRKNLTPEEYRKVAPILEEYEKQNAMLFDRYREVSAKLSAYNKTIYNQKEKISALYAELSEVKKTASILESIPLLGSLISILRELREEARREVLLSAIDHAKKIERSAESLDYKVLSAEKRRIVERLFGRSKNVVEKDGFDR